MDKHSAELGFQLDGSYLSPGTILAPTLSGIQVSRVGLKIAMCCPVIGSGVTM